MKDETTNVNHILQETNEDLVVVITSDLKRQKQCRTAAAKANRALAQIKNSFTSLIPDTLKLLFNALVRPHLEYAVSVWSPSLKSDIKVIENVQRRATKLVKAIKNLPYEERLRKLKMMSLKSRRTRGDLIRRNKLNKRHQCRKRYRVQIASTT